MARRILLLFVAALTFVGCGRQAPPLERASTIATWAAAPPVDPAPPVFVVAHVTGKSIPVFAAPGAPAPARTLSNPNEDGAPRVFLVKSQQTDWLEVMVPVRPNGTRGWIRSSDVSLTQHSWRALVEVGANRLTVWNGKDIFVQESVAVGTGGTPTPTGDYYITELLKPDDPGGAYGPYAFGLSAFSDVLKTFAGGPGVIGMHGTNNSSSIGRAVSHGCIRLTNASITKLAENMPVGTPISIVA
jgi:lipoprotein-anchoring transpeptidase ErfK/SrfK